MDAEAYKKHLEDSSNDDLLDIQRNIDPIAYPDRYQMLLEEINSREFKDPIKEEQEWMGFVKVSVKRAFVWPTRAVFLCIAILPIIEIHEILSTGIAESRGSVWVLGSDSFGYFTLLGKYIAYSFLFLWLGTFGTIEKRGKSDV
jgi:hypothetical protein